MHHALYWYNINKTMRHELEFFCDKLKPDLGINWGTPIAHLIPRTSFATMIGNSSLTGAGGFLIALGFWWHITFPDKVIQCTLHFKSDNVDGTLILINFLEFVTVIINYCAALHVVRTHYKQFSSCPSRHHHDNIFALNWTIQTCKRCKIGHLLARFFCSLLINVLLGMVHACAGQKVTPINLIVRKNQPLNRITPIRVWAGTKNSCSVAFLQ